MEFTRAERDQFHVIQPCDRIGDVMPGYACASRQAVVANGRYASTIPKRQDGQINLHGVERQLSEVEFAQQQHAPVVTVV